MAAKQTNLPQKSAACGSGRWHVVDAVNERELLPAQTGVKSKPERERETKRERNVARQLNQNKQSKLKSKLSKAN